MNDNSMEVLPLTGGKVSVHGTSPRIANMVQPRWKAEYQELYAPRSTMRILSDSLHKGDRAAACLNAPCSAPHVAHATG